MFRDVAEGHMWAYGPYLDRVELMSMGHTTSMDYTHVNGLHCHLRQ